MKYKIMYEENTEDLQDEIIEKNSMKEAEDYATSKGKWSTITYMED